MSTITIRVPAPVFVGALTVLGLGMMAGLASGCFSAAGAGASDAGFDSSDGSCGPFGCGMSAPTMVTLRGTVVSAPIMATGPAGPPDAGVGDAGGTAAAGSVPLTGATVTWGSSATGILASATTDASGAFTMSAMAPTGTTSVMLTASLMAFAPQIVTVPVKDGVTTYTGPITLTALGAAQTVSPTSTTTMTIQLPGPGNVPYPAILTIPAGGTVSQVLVAPIQIGNSPGNMQAQGGPPGDALASLGMVYFNFLDGSGTQVDPPKGTTISLGAQTPPTIPASDPFNAWTLNSQGNWDTPTPMTPPAAKTPSPPAPVTTFGYWNSDHAFRTACIKGTLESSAGVCAGAHLDLTGPDGIHSTDTSGADGSFCLVGPQGHSGTLASGGTVTFPGSAGNCSVPSSCTDVGMFKMNDPAQCQNVPTPYTADFTCNITGVSNCVLVADIYRPDSDDVPPTIADVANPITGSLTNLADCTTSAQAAAERACTLGGSISPDGNDFWYCTVTFSTPVISNCAMH